MDDLFVVDWELSQVSLPALDLAQMLAELYLLKHFRDIDTAVTMMEAFIDAYGPIGYEDALLVAIGFGTHLVVWPWRVQSWGDEESFEKAVEIGRDFIVNAQKRNTKWFLGGVLERLFAPIK
jgi:hypothetical protein